MSPAVLNDMPSSPPITELHAWIGLYADGREGLLATGLQYPDGTTQHLPLINSSREVATRFSLIAQEIQEASRASEVAGRIIRVELRTYRLVTTS